MFEHVETDYLGRGRTKANGKMIRSSSAKANNFNPHNDNVILNSLSKDRISNIIEPSIT